MCRLWQAARGALGHDNLHEKGVYAASEIQSAIASDSHVCLAVDQLRDA